MANHRRKRQKTSDTQRFGQNKEARLALLLDEESKDDEERQLESLLFGVKYEPRNRSAGAGAGDSANESERGEREEGGRGMQHLLDQDVCISCPCFRQHFSVLKDTME